MNTNNQEIQNVIQARQMVRWMGQGVLPSQENASKAQTSLRDFVATGDHDLNPRVAIRVTGAMAMGVVPSEEMCGEAEVEITQMLDLMRETDSSKLRDSFRQRG
jgi:hypothetical protein